MDPKRVFGMAVLFGALWVSLAYFQKKITDPAQLAGGFLLFVVAGPVLAWVVRFVLQWWKGRS